MEPLVPSAVAIATATATATTATATATATTTTATATTATTTSAATSATYGCSGNSYWVRDKNGKITFFPPTDTFLNRTVSERVDGYRRSYDDDGYSSSDDKGAYPRSDDDGYPSSDGG